MPYLLAIALTGVTLATRVAAGGAFENPTMILFTIPIVLSAYLGGLWPGILATVSSALGMAYFVLPPLHDLRVFSPTQRLQEGVLLLSGTLISVICMRLHQARRRSEVVIGEMQYVQSELHVALQSAGNLRQALDQHAIVAVTDKRGRITFVNDKFCDISQYSRQELIGQDHRLINSSFHPPEFIRTLWQTISRGEVWHGEIRNRAKDGSMYWVYTTIVPFVDENGTPEQYIAIRADITERKNVEAALLDSEQRFRTMANSMPQLAWIAHADGFIHWYNQRWFEYTGTTPEQMEGWGWQSVHDPRVLPEVMHSWELAIASGMPFEMEFPLRAADGQFRKFLTRVEPFKNAEGAVMQWFGTNTDVDELKRAQEQVHELNAGLERRVVERTAEVEAANHELEAFSYSVSHDLRAPLRAINGFAELTLRRFGPQLPTEAERYLGRIKRGGQQMGNLIDDLLAFSRMSRLPVKRVMVDMASLVEEVLGDDTISRENRDIEFRIGELPSCQGDATLLRQVWINLISNAVKYSRVRDKAIIEISSEMTDGERAYFIRDNGTGFDMQYADKLFGVFQRLHRPEDFQGTGVGLAIVQRIVQRHGGRVWASAVLDQGATFRFVLPMSAAV